MNINRLVGKCDTLDLRGKVNIIEYRDISSLPNLQRFGDNYIVAHETMFSRRLRESRERSLVADFMIGTQ